jgi:hypothetical protein
MPDPHQHQQQLAQPAVVVAAPPTGPTISAVLPSVAAPVSSIILLITVLTGSMALIVRSLWQRPAIRAGLAAIYAFSSERSVRLLASVRRGRRWIAQAATLFFVLVLALIQWRR